MSESGVTGDEILSTLSREFVLFDLTPVALVSALASLVLVATDVYSAAPSLHYLVDGSLAATSTALLLWWFAVVGLSLVLRPVLRVAVRLAAGDPGQALREMAPFARSSRPVKWMVGWLRLYGPLGKARGEHMYQVGLAPGRTMSEMREHDPAAFEIVKEHRERWEMTLRLSLALLAGSIAFVPFVAHNLLWLLVPAAGLLSGVSAYYQATSEYQAFSRVFLAARNLPAVEVR